MATYGSSGDVRLILGNPTETEVSATILGLERTHATNLVDGYLEKAYPSKVPFTGDVPALVDSLTNDIAVYYIKRDTHPGPLPLSEDVKAEYWERPIETLEKIAKRELELPELTSGLTDRIESNRSAYTPIFDVDNIESAVVDEDLLDDVEDARE